MIAPCSGQSEVSPVKTPARSASARRDVGVREAELRGQTERAWDSPRAVAGIFERTGVPAR